jgi:RecB family endonuclease NucS
MRDDLPPESWLESTLLGSAANLSAVVNGVSSTIDVDFGLWKAWNQNEIDGGGRCDILVVSEDRTTALVIEIKRLADENAISQVLRYVGYIRHSAALKVIPVVAACEFTQGYAAASSAAGVFSFKLTLAARIVYPAISDEPGLARLGRLGEFLAQPPTSEEEYLEWEIPF